ncbi:MAG: FAD-linked oxidase C-terminal domain-containing protein [Candidatus Krumholzibacteria bacterium]|nr:FAD-linked oxidase C-terminal domain-containing protein [Candidatus Krumholzibacteria bacterium]MDP7022095.1 FAD-linked oxidase C-terminal domain-containing protein [Candidatus Krumholzibacteria bacterium]
MSSRRIDPRLRRILAPEDILDSEGDRHLYRHDSQKIHAALPDLILFPRSTSQVMELVVLARESGTALTARGAGTGLSGGAVPRDGGWLLSFTRMRKLLSIDEPSRLAWLQPGMVNRELQELLRPRGLCFAPDPSSQTVSTLGGNFAENAGGPHCLKLGVTSQHVLGLEWVDDCGELHRLGCSSPGGNPLDAVGLFCGSEGTLGLVTALQVKLSRRPECARTLLAPYSSLRQASTAASRILGRGHLPAALEMMDRESIRSVENSPFRAGFPRESEAVLLVELDGFKGEVERESREVSGVLRETGAISLSEAVDEAERKRLWRGRKGAFGAAGRLFRDICVQDICVPVSRLAEATVRVSEAVKEEGLPVACIYHAGDGNLHPNIGYDREDREQLASLDRACEQIMKISVELGGNLSGEHGIGVEKSGWLPLFLSREDREPHLRLKAGLDPQRLFNPGKIFPPEDEGEGTRLAIGLVPALLSPEEPCSFERPETVGSLSHILGAKTRGLLLPTGARFPEELPPLPSSVGLLLSTASLRGIRDFSREDFQVEAFAGTPWTEVQEFLANEGMEIDFPVSHAGERSLGGVIACDEAWPFRSKLSNPRDRLLGLEGLLADGSFFRAGGRSVKNVCAYDLCRLMAGSRGSLSIMTSFRLRCRPVPEERSLLLLEYAKREEAVQIGRMLSSLYDSIAGPLLIPPGLGLSGSWLLAIGMEGRGEGLDELREEIRELLNREQVQCERIWTESRDSEIMKRLRDFPALPGEGERHFLRELRGPVDRLLTLPPYLGSRWILDIEGARLRIEEHSLETKSTGSVSSLMERQAEISRRGAESPSTFTQIPGRSSMERIARSLDPSLRLAPGRWLFD